MNDQKRIPLAPSARWRRIRLQVIPVVCFAAAVLVSGWLWQRRGAAVHSLGQVDAPRIDVTSPATGLVVSLHDHMGGQWSLYDSVRAGDVLARFDDRPLQADRELLLHEVEQLVSQIERLEPAANLSADVRAAIDQAKQQELLRLAALEQQLTSAPGIVPDGSNDLAAAELPDAVPEETRNVFSQFIETRRGLELRGKEMRLRSELLEIRSPISGTIVAVHCWPGQTVSQGGLIATVAADHGRHIVSYLPEDSSLVPEPGMRVTIRSRWVGSLNVPSEVEQVGRQIEGIPARYLLSPTAGQRGLPVRIRLPAEVTLLPGSMVDVVYHTSG
jgi:multidrug resistance efflux pump